MVQQRVVQTWELRGRDRTQKATRSARVGLQRLGNAARGATARVIALAGTAGFGLLIRRSFNLIDELDKVSERLGTTVNGLAALQFQAELSGASTETVNQALRDLNIRLGEISSGGGSANAVRALQQIGVS